MKINLKNTMATLLITGVSFFIGENPALASSTQVTFQVPVRVQGVNSSRLTTEVYCAIGQPGNFVARARAMPTERFSGVSNWDGTVTVVVRAERGVTFHKGDLWYCEFNNISGRARSLAPTSVLRVEGHL